MGADDLEGLVASNRFNDVADALVEAGCTQVAYLSCYDPAANTTTPFLLYQLPPDGSPDGSSLFLAMKSSQLHPEQLARALFWRAGRSRNQTPKFNALVALTTYTAFQDAAPPKPAMRQAAADVLDSVAKGIGIFNFLALTLGLGSMLYMDSPEGQKPLALALGAAAAAGMLLTPAVILYLRIKQATANSYYPGRVIKEGFSNRLEGRGALEAAFSLSGRPSTGQILPTV